METPSFKDHKDILPKRGEKLKYIWNSVENQGKTRFETPQMTCGNYYEIRDVRFLPCKDQIMIVDDTLMWFWVDLHKFNFRDDA